jgi:hypothetical protein
VFSIKSNLSCYKYLIIVSLDNIAVQVPPANASGMIGAVCDTNGTNHTLTDYEDIDEAKPVVQPHDTMFENSMHDYSRTPHPFEMSNYEVPLQSTMSKVCVHYTNSLSILMVKK